MVIKTSHCTQTVSCQDTLRTDRDHHRRRQQTEDGKTYPTHTGMLPVSRMLHKQRKKQVENKETQRKTTKHNTEEKSYQETTKLQITEPYISYI